ncbi:MAG TPA: M48 family metallopeptidase, partial [Aquabacterium sp.]|nr:M48 family metallopeptidase [Aquabacterium sp.]
MYLLTRNLSKYLRARLAFSVVVAASLSACTSTTKDSEVGAGRKQLLLVSEESVVNQAQAYYTQERSEAAKKGTLVGGGREYQRLRVILNKMLPATVAIRPDAANWKWELTLIDEPDTVNAHVLAGGKVTFYTGLIVRTSATDDELAAVMGHEIAHALREHTREKISQSSALGAARSIGLTILGADAATQRAAQATQQLALDLPFSRAMESEADALGLELAARAGYKPRGAVTLWEKMAKLSTGGPAFLSTHPESQDRRNALEALLP